MPVRRNQSAGIMSPAVYLCDNIVMSLKEMSRIKKGDGKGGFMFFSQVFSPVSTKGFWASLVGILKGYRVPEIERPTQRQVPRSLARVVQRSQILEAINGSFLREDRQTSKAEQSSEYYSAGDRPCKCRRSTSRKNGRAGKKKEPRN